MNKMIKVGDKVRVSKNINNSDYFIGDRNSFRGIVGIVSKIDAQKYFPIQIDFGKYSFANDFTWKRKDIELVEDDFNIENIKSGMVIKTRNNTRYFAVDYMGDIVFINKNGYMKKSTYSKNMKITDKTNEVLESDFDIVEVYKVKNEHSLTSVMYDIYGLSNDKIILIWMEDKNPKVIEEYDLDNIHARLFSDGNVIIRNKTKNIHIIKQDGTEYAIKVGEQTIKNFKGNFMSLSKMLNRELEVKMCAEVVRSIGDKAVFCEIPKHIECKIGDVVETNLGQGNRLAQVVNITEKTGNISHKIMRVL